MPDVRLINANELLRVIDEEIEYGAEYAVTNYQLINEGLKIARKDIKCAPTIDAQPVKRGNWKQDASGELYCPYCMYVPQWEDDKFCANCGARMDGGAG